MKKFTKLFLFLIALIFWSTNMWAVDVQVGFGTTTSSSLPIVSCYNYNYSQQIYLGSELETGGGGAGPINKIRFYFSSGSDFNNWEDWTIYLGNTDKASFSGNTDWVAIGDLTEAFSGIIPTPVAGTWLEITLDTPFDYTGGNIVVAVDENSDDYYCSSYWGSFNAVTTRGIYYRNDNTNPDPSAPPTANSTTSTIARVQFDMAAFVPTLPPNCAVNVSPVNEATEVLETATLNWLSGGGAPEGYYLYFGTDNPPTNIENGSDLGDVNEYIPASLDFGITYYWQVVAYNAIGPVEGCDVWSFTTREEPGMLSGTVTDLDTGLFIEGATVSAEGDAGFGQAETDAEGYYEMELAPGDYDVICEAAGYETGGLVDFSITLLPGQELLLNFTLAPIIGAYCTNPILIDAFPYQDLGQTNCGMGNIYSATCLGYYDGGEDIFYSFTLTATTAINITFNPYLTTYTGIAVIDQCPPPAEGCIASVTNSGTSIRTIENLVLDAGTYYIMIDTWSAPDCIPEFDLMIEEYIPPLVGCKYTVKLYDSYGDGWNGNTLTVNVNGNPVLNQVTLDNGSGPAIFEFYAETDDLIDFIFEGTNYADENTYNVFDANDVLVFEDGPEPTGGSIVADCGDCQYSVVLWDTYGDGWGGGQLDVIVDGIPVLEDITLPSGYGPEEFFFTVFTGSIVDFDYTAGSWAYENYYYAYDANGMEVFSSGLGGSTPVDGQVTGNCVAETGILEGFVTDDITDLPIEGATVVANDGVLEYSTQTDTLGAYEMVLVTGDYDVTATAPGYEPGGVLDVIITINANLTTPLNFNLLPMLGASCANPILIDALPYQDLGQTNCGLGNIYSATCLGYYDGGDDIIYKFVMDETATVNIVMDPKTTTYTGMAIFDGCPDVGNCIEFASYSAADTLRIDNLLLDAGTYYLMIDTWPSPYCIPEFDLFINEVIPGLLSGVVTGLDSGNPLSGISVVVEPGGISIFTNASGEYELGLMPGDYEVTFSHIDYYTLTESGVAIVSEDTTSLSVALETMPAPVCANLISPIDNSINNYPDIVLEWESLLGSPTVLGYKISLYNLTLDEWVEENTDLGNVTTYTPTQPFDWGTGYVWLLTPYNNAGETTGCGFWSFTTSYAGVIDGYVEDAESGMQLEGVDVSVVEVFPNSGYTHDLTTDVDGNWELEWETGVYNITFSKFGYLTKTVNTVSIFNGQITYLNTTLDPVTPYPMPYVEDWNTGSFVTQKWTKEGNWGLYTEGNPAPAARFNWTPVVYDYDVLLKSHFIDARNESQVYLQFDLRLMNEWGNDTYETLQFEVFDGISWHVIDVFDNLFESFPWETNTYDISNLVVGGLFQIGFRAVGENSYYIDDWLVDNILVTNSIFEVDPPSVSDVLFFNEIKTYDIDLLNFGNVELDWDAEIIPASPWASLNEVSGTLAPPSGSVELTFDAALAGPGTHTAEIKFTALGGLFEKTVMLELKVYQEAGQKIMIPEPNSWGYISAYIDMDAKVTLEELFADVVDDMVILIGEGGIYWPGYFINTLDDYDTYKGYKMKMGGDGSLAFLGDMVETQTASFNTGIAMIPVLSEEPVSAEAIFGGHDIEFAFGLDGSIYWPAGPVMTLTTLYPGFGYLVKFNEPTTLDFDVPPKTVVPNKPVAFANSTTWNDVYKTSGFHLIGITAEATAELQKDDIIGVFNSDGLCTGMVNYSGSNEALAIPVFIDDITSLEVDGMAEYEPMQINIFRDGEEIAVNPVYSSELPNHNGLFATNGYSVITSFKEGSTGIVDNSSSIRVYPNPSEGMYNIDGFDGTFQIVVSNSQGQLILKKEINDDYQLDLTTNPNGIYFIRLTNEQSVKLVKVIKQ